MKSIRKTENPLLRIVLLTLSVCIVFGAFLGLTTKSSADEGTPAAETFEPRLPEGAIAQYNAGYEKFMSDHGLETASVATDGKDYGEIYRWYVTYGLSDAQITAMTEAADEIIARIDPNWTDMQKALYVNDYLASTCHYDTSYSYYDAYHLLVEKTAVCQGYANAYCFIMNRMNIGTRVVESDALNHAWNLILIDGKWYHVDVTWNDPTKDLPGRARHFYFLLSDSAISDSSHKHAASDWELYPESRASGAGYATDKTYDSYFWSDVDAPIPIYNGCYYLVNDSGVVKRTFSGTETTVADLSSTRWYVKGGGGGWWVGIFSGCVIHNGRLYYNLPESIVSCNPDGSDKQTFFELTDSQKTGGSIYGCFLDGDTLYYTYMQGANSDTRTVYSLELPKPVASPAAVTGFKADSATETTLKLSWNKSSDADGYVIEQDVNGAWKRIADITSNSTVTYNVTGLSSETTYKFRIIAYKKGYVFGPETVTTGTTAAAKPLGPVTGLKIGGTAKNALRLNWAMNSDADGYIIEQYISGKWTRIAKINENSTTTYRVSGLSPATAYKFRIKAFRLSPTTVYSSYAAVTGITTLPAVSGFKPASSAETAVRFEWAVNEYADGYIIEQLQGTEWVRVKKITNNGTVSYRLTGLAPASTTSVRIQAYKSVGGTTVYSDFQTVTADTKLLAMNDLQIAGTAKDALRLSWEKNSAADGYIVEQYKNGEWVRIKKITVKNTVTVRISGLDPLTEYKFRVQAYSAANSRVYYSDYSTVTGITDLAEIGGFNIAGTASTALRLGWNKNANADGYIIEQYINGKWTRIKKTTDNSTFYFRVTKLDPNTTYKFRIRAYAIKNDQVFYSAYAIVSGTTSK